MTLRAAGRHARDAVGRQAAPLTLLQAIATAARAAGAMIHAAPLAPGSVARWPAVARFLTGQA